jgi:branched-chain amino acid aminotransferase
VLELGRELGLPAAERDLSLTELYTADEAFGTGTMGELTPVVEVDGRRIGSGQGGPLTAQLSEAFHARVASGRWSAPFP